MRLYTIILKGLPFEDMLSVHAAIQATGWTPEVKQEGHLD